MENWSAHHLYQEANKKLGCEKSSILQKYAKNLILADLAVIFSLRHLSQISNVDYSVLRDTVKRKCESANYSIFAIKKRSGGRRFIHAVSGRLFTVQQFINTEILQKVELHPSSFAFHPNGGIRKCAQMHCGARWLFHFDIENFFYNVTEVHCFKIF
jgi:RNA-directed DNA polymerase